MLDDKTKNEIKDAWATTIDMQKDEDEIAFEVGLTVIGDPDSSDFRKDLDESEVANYAWSLTLVALDDDELKLIQKKLPELYKRLEIK